LAFRLVITIKQQVYFSFHTLQKRFLCWVKPPSASLVLGTLTDLLRGKSELIAENALLRQQLSILHRQIKRPVYKKTDRLLLVLLARGCTKRLLRPNAIDELLGPIRLFRQHVAGVFVQLDL
jgi:hypothetical protein